MHEQLGDCVKALQDRYDAGLGEVQEALRSGAYRWAKNRMQELRTIGYGKWLAFFRNLQQGAEDRARRDERDASRVPSSKRLKRRTVERREPLSLSLSSTVLGRTS